MIKKTILLFTLFISISAYSQTSKRDYNYFTNEYAEVFEKSLETPKKYTLKPIKEMNVKNYSFYTNEVYLTETNEFIGFSTVAVKEKSNKNKNKYYMFPINNGDLIVKYNNDKSKGGITLAYYYNLVFDTVMSMYLDKQLNNK